jgi:pyruvate,water dikinase
MFTRNPLTGACERVIEASWGLGETVVSGTVTPDSYVVGTDGCVRAVTTGEKDVAIRCTDRGVVEHEVSGPRVYERCLTDADLIALHELAIACDDVFGCSDHDIEFAFRGGALYLLQRRPITHA